MEEMRAEKSIWHKNCFRCSECSKPLRYVDCVDPNRKYTRRCAVYKLKITCSFLFIDSVDTYESHTGVLYCKQHFKSLFSPKAVEDSEPGKLVYCIRHFRTKNSTNDSIEAPRKPELIIRESQPIELPPDVVRSSDKTDLGLTELQQLNVKERYQVFENRKQEESQKLLDREDRTVKRGATILSKLAK